MKNQFNRQKRHNNNARSARSGMQQITRFTILDSSGPLGKLRGTALQLAEKYQAGAKDAQTQGDDVLFQTCQQYADHYLRLQAMAIENEQPKTVVEEPVISGETAEMEANTVEGAETSEPPAPVIEKKQQVRHKKAPDPLAMPMEALQEKSERAE